MAEKEIAGNVYATLAMPPMVQKRVLTRLGPTILPVLKATMSAKGKDLLRMLNSKGAASQDEGDLLDLMGVLADAAEAIMRMPDEESDYVISTCLLHVQRRDPATGLWQTVWNGAARQPQFADIDLPTMMKLTFFVLADKLGGFFPAGFSISPSGSAPPPGSISSQ